MYKVIHYFHDKEDEHRPYNVGDVFPYRGKVSKKRLEELSTDKNRQKKQPPRFPWKYPKLHTR